MNILITAGNTHAPIDRVRVITNVFTGRTGANLARTAWVRGHRITVLTSQPYTLSDLPEPGADSDRRANIIPFQTYDDLARRFQEEVRSGAYDCIIHCAAISDYLCAGTFSPDGGTYFNARTMKWEQSQGRPSMVEHKDGKIKSTEPELWLRLVRAPKLIDRVRKPWNFDGILVKFKLEVGIGDNELVSKAEKARIDSDADLIVANTLESSAHIAYLGPINSRYDRIDRRELAERLILEVEEMHRHRVTEAEA